MDLCYLDMCSIRIHFEVSDILADLLTLNNQLPFRTDVCLHCWYSYCYINKLKSGYTNNDMLQIVANSSCNFEESKKIISMPVEKNPGTEGNKRNNSNTL